MAADEDRHLRGDGPGKRVARREPLEELLFGDPARPDALGLQEGDHRRAPAEAEEPDAKEPREQPPERQTAPSSATDATDATIVIFVKNVTLVKVIAKNLVSQKIFVLLAVKIIVKNVMVVFAVVMVVIIGVMLVISDKKFLL